MFLSNKISTHRTQAALNVCPGILAPSSQAETERDALAELFQSFLTTQSQLSIEMNEAIENRQRADEQLMTRFQGLSTMNNTLNTTAIAVTSQMEQLTHVTQTHQVAQDTEMQRLQARIALLEQEKAEELLKRNQEAAEAASRQTEVIQALTRAHKAEMEILKTTHAATIGTLESSRQTEVEAALQIHLRAMEVLNNELSESRQALNVANTNITHRDEELKQTKDQLIETQKELSEGPKDYAGYLAMQARMYRARQNNPVIREEFIRQI